MHIKRQQNKNLTMFIRESYSNGIEQKIFLQLPPTSTSTSTLQIYLLYIKDEIFNFCSEIFFSWHTLLDTSPFSARGRSAHVSRAQKGKQRVARMLFSSVYLNERTKSLDFFFQPQACVAFCMC